MSDKRKTDYRTQKEIQTETINSTLELQDEVEMLFPWKILLHDNEITINNDTIQVIIKYIKQLKEENNLIPEPIRPPFRELLKSPPAGRCPKETPRVNKS